MRERFRRYPSFNAKLPPTVSLPGVTVHTVFHAVAGGFDVARSICTTGFAALSATDLGYFSQGYFSFELDYVVQQYGGDGDADGNVAVIVCNVVVGNMYPVIENPGGPNSLNGKPPVPKYDCHGVILRSVRPVPAGEVDTIWCDHILRARHLRQRVHLAALRAVRQAALILIRHACSSKQPVL